MRVILLTGKGGVGKTSLAAATALGAAAAGHRVFLLSTDPAHSLGDALGEPIGAGAREIAAGLTAQEVGVLHEMDRSWAEVQAFLRQLLRSETDELLAEELLVFPGLEELFFLRAVREVEATGQYDTCVVDCAPTGATLRMLRFPDALRIFMENFFEWERRGARLLRPLAERTGTGSLIPRDDVFAAVERLYDEVETVRQILLDEERTSARLVVNPARVVVEETRRSFSYLSLYGVATDAVLVNRLLPDEASEGYFAQWKANESRELERIESSFPVPRFHAPLYPSEVVGVEALERLARDVYGGRDPAELFTRSRPIRLRKRAGRTCLEIDLGPVSKEEIDVSAHGDVLIVRVRDATRWISLPESVKGRPIVRAKLRGPVLEVTFGD